MTELKNMLKALCEADGVTGLNGAKAVAKDYLSKYAEVSENGGSLIGKIKGKSDYTVMLDAHIDEIGMVVTSVKDGFVKVSSVGGIDGRMLPALRVKIHGKQTVTGVFTSVPPHLKNKDDDSAPKIDELYIDTGLGKTAEEIISVGDRVNFAAEFAELLGNRVTCKSLDDRAGVAALIRTAELLSGKEVPCNVVILLSDMEEIGGDGAKVESYTVNPDEAVAVDVSFGDSPDIPAEKTGVLGKGSMLGISPTLSREVTNELRLAAEKEDLPIQYEAMGGNTSTNADDITVTRGGVKTGLLSIPLRNMHTPVEVIDVADVECTAKILARYILDKKA